MNGSGSLLTMSQLTNSIYPHAHSGPLSYSCAKPLVVSPAAVGKGPFGVQYGNETRAGVGACGVLHNVSPPFPCGIGIVGKVDILSQNNLSFLFEKHTKKKESILTRNREEHALGSCVEGQKSVSSIRITDCPPCVWRNRSLDDPFFIFVQ